MTKLISLERLSLFWDKVKAYFMPKIEKIDRKIWMGKEADLQAAIDAGLVDESTTIVLTDGESGTVYSFATYEDILALFPQYTGRRMYA